MKYNQLVQPQSMVTNYEHAPAFPLSSEKALYTAVVTFMLNETFYEKPDQRVYRICNLVKKCDPYFVAQLAVYTRLKMNLRSVPLLLAVELAKHHNGDYLVSRVVEKIVARADEIMELLTCYQWRNRDYSKSKKKLKKLSNQIQLGLQQSFNHFDEYQFAKYNNPRRIVKLRDALFLVHPKAKDEAQQAIFDKIAHNSLAVPYTWETELSALGKQPFESEELRERALADKWHELIIYGRLGYMALLRNLRNLINCQYLPEEVIAEVCRHLSDPKKVMNDKVFPFRYLSAFRELRDCRDERVKPVLRALESAVLQSFEHLKGFFKDEQLLLAADVSGSMHSRISSHSNIRYFDIGLLMAMGLKRSCPDSQIITRIFGTSWKEVNLPSKSILRNVQKLYMLEGTVGYATNGYKVLVDLLKREKKVDKIMFFTDCQMWDSTDSNEPFLKCWHRYKRKYPDTKLYLFDLAGYGNTPVSIAEKDVYLIAGWSDKIFEILDCFEHQKDVLSEIKKIEL